MRRIDVDDKQKQLTKIVGEKFVLGDPQILETYSRDQSFAKPMRPLLVVKPKNAEEVQSVVEWANETNTPLVPVSSGAPHFYGGTVPSVPGAVIVDLSRMNEIKHVSLADRSASVEPGVTYAQLIPALDKAGLVLDIPLLPSAKQSVIASCLERQPKMTPNHNWSLLDPLQSVDIVWGCGERQAGGGMGGGPAPGTKIYDDGEVPEIPRFKGAAHCDWHRLVSGAQGSMGIVTSGSLKCRVKSKVHRLIFLAANDLTGLIDCAYRILRLRWGEEFILLNNANLADLLGGGLDKIKALKEELPPWVMSIGISGQSLFSEERANINEAEIKDIAQQFGLQGMSAIPGVTAGQMLEVILHPSPEPYWKLGFKGACEDIFFQTTLDKTPQFVRTMYSIAENLRYPTSDIGVYIQPQHQGTCCHCEFNLPFNPGIQKEAEKVKEFSTKASEELMRQGAYFSRPYGKLAEMMFSRNFTAIKLLKDVRKILDPNNILNPGKLCF